MTTVKKENPFIKVSNELDVAEVCYGELNKLSILAAARVLNWLLEIMKEKAVWERADTK